MKFIISVLAAVLLLYSCVNNSSGKTKLNNLREFEKTGTNYEDGLGIKDQKKGSDDKIDTLTRPGKSSSKQLKNDVPEEVTKADWDKKIIKTANLTLEIKDFKSYYKSLKEKIRIHGGYTAQEEQSQDNYKIENQISIKIPVEQFENSIASITENVEKVQEKNITSHDVSTEFVDTRARMESKKKVRQRYLDFLKQAKTMEEILQVQSVVNGIQEEIESASGRMEYLGHASAFSTINLNFYQVLNPQSPTIENYSYGAKIAKAFQTGWSWVANLFVGLITVWPLLLLTAIVLLLLKKFKRIHLSQASKSS